MEKGGEIAVAVIVKQDTTGKKCWACGIEVGNMANDEAVIVSIGARDVLYMHPNCAKSISQQLLRDLAQLIDLGYEVEDV